MTLKLCDVKWNLNYVGLFLNYPGETNDNNLETSQPMELLITILFLPLLKHLDLYIKNYIYEKIISSFIAL